jgi:hypothetical protein
MNHAGYYYDSMTTKQHLEMYIAGVVGGAPMAIFDRVKFTGESYLGINRGSLAVGETWQQRAAQRNVMAAPVDLAIQPSYDAATNKLTIKVDTKLMDAVPSGNMALNIVLVEDNVQRNSSAISPATGFDQRNTLNTIQGHPMFGKGDPIYSYVHKRVARHYLTGTWGEQIPALTVGNTLSKTYTFDFDTFAAGGLFQLNSSTYYPYTSLHPAAWDKTNLSVVAFLSYYNVTDVADRTVINASEASLKALGINETAGAPYIDALYPNPTSGLTVATFTLKKAGQVTANVMDMTGRQVQKVGTQGLYGMGTHTLQFDASTLAKGIYFLNVNVDGQTSAKKLIVE